MYEWHISEIEWNSMALHFDTIEQQQSIINGSFNVIKYLLNFYTTDRDIGRYLLYYLLII
jgi:hypothetical protein